MGVVVGSPVLPPEVRALPSITGITLESTARDPEDAVGGRAPSVSEDGRLVAFVGPPTGRDDRDSTAYLRDRDRDVLVQLTPRSAGIRTGETVSAVVSADGCSVTVLTQLPLNLFVDDDLGDRWDVYRAPLPECSTSDVREGLDWELVSSDAEGSAVNTVDPTSEVGVSTTGTVIAYVAPVARKSDLRRVMVADLTVRAGEAGRVRPAPGLPGEPSDNGSSYRGQFDPAVSGDGAAVAFTSDARADQSTPVWAEVRRPGDEPATQVYLWNRDLGSVDLVSVVPGSTRLAGSSGQASLSADGRTVAFTSTSQDLVAARYPKCPAGGCTTTQVFVSELDGNDDGTADDPALTLASRRPSQKDTDIYVAGNGSSSLPSISADGSMVAFVTRAANLLASAAEPGLEPTDGDILVTDLGSGSIRRASVRPDTATPALGSNSAPALSGTGRVVTFETAVGAEMVPGTPTDGERQVVSATFPVELSMPALDVGTVPPKWPSPEWFVSVTNTGASSFVPTRITASDEQFEITGGSCFGASVPPGGSCSVRVVFTPRAGGDVMASLTVAEEGFNPAHVTSLLAGSGGEPYLSASPAGVAFDDTVVGGFTDAETITVTNTGFDQAVLEDVRLTGPHPEDFAIVDSTCDATILVPTTDCQVKLSFLPRSSGVRSALVTITTSSGSRTSVVLGGVGTYRPSISAPEMVVAGRPLMISGEGYAPDTALLIGWADGAGRELTVLVDADGTFTARFPLASRERPGSRDIVVSDPSNLMPTVRSTVMVRPDR
jgi:Tol biopolymer transport system component